MDNIPILLILASAAGFVWTVVRFFHNGRYANCDLMGAHMTFHHMWLLSATVLAVGASLLPGHHWMWGVAVAGAGFILSLPAKSAVEAGFGLFGWGEKFDPDAARRKAGSFAATCNAEARTGQPGIQPGATPEPERRGGRERSA